MGSILDVPRVASGPRRDRLPCPGATEIRMSVGRKAKPEKSLASLQPGKTPYRPEATVDKNAASQPEPSIKSGKPERKVEFAQGTYYRQGVLVPGGPHKGPMPRVRNR